MSILNKIIFRSMKQNKKRTQVTILAITLCSVLFLTLGLFFSTVRQVSINEIINSQGNYETEFFSVESSLIKNIENESNISEYITYIDTKGLFNVGYIGYPISSMNNESLNKLELINGSYPTSSSEVIISDNFNLSVGQIMKNQDEEYKVVGIFKKNKLYPTEVISYSSYDNEKINVRIRYNDYKDIKGYASNIAQKLQVNNYSFNNSLLGFYNASVDKNISVTSNIILLLLIVSCTIIGIFVLLVIYNSYAVSVIERKKMYGVLSSVGATKKQIILSMLFEALIEFIIGIVLGTIISIGVMKLGIYLINNFFETNYYLCYYPLFIIISLIILLVFVLLSSIMPAIEASFISPIEALRSTNDIKNKEIKNNKLLDKIYGIEGTLALKNIKRNKRKFGVTLFSIIISFTLFVVFMTLFNYIMVGVNDSFNIPKYDYKITINDENQSNINQYINKISKIDSIKEMNVYKYKEFVLNNFNKQYLNDKYKENFVLNTISDYMFINIITMPDEYYNEFIKKIGAQNGDSIIINYTEREMFDSLGQSLGLYRGKIFNEKNMNLDIYQIVSTYSENTNPNKEVNKVYSLNKIYYTNNYPLGLQDKKDVINIIVNTDIYNSLPETGFKFINNPYLQNNKELDTTEIIFKIKGKTNDFEKELKNNEHVFNNYSYLNVKDELRKSYMTLIMITIIMVVFLIFIALISIINIYNSISTSIRLRKREFILLKSTGMSYQSFNKMITVESMLLCFKAIIWGLIMSSSIIYLFYKIFELENTLLGNKGTIKFTIPLLYIFIACIITTLEIWLINNHESKKRIKNNIVDSLKEEIY